MRVHGHDRDGELRDAIAAGTARVVERPGRICGYATGFGYGWHAVAETNEDLIALLASAETFMGLGIIVPSRNAELLAVVPRPRAADRPAIDADDDRPLQRADRRLAAVDRILDANREPPRIR